MVQPGVIARFFDGLELVSPYEGAEPGLTFTGIWGAEDPVLADSEGQRWLYCGVAGGRDRQAHGRGARHRPGRSGMAALGRGSRCH